MEAVSFEYYLTTASILSFEDAATLLRKNSEGRGVELSPEDYILGIFDMTGELMRFAITSMATSGSLPGLSQESNASGQRNVLNDMRALRSALEALNAGHGPFAKDVSKKMDVMRSSVEKVEKSLYVVVSQIDLLLETLADHISHLDMDWSSEVLSVQKDGCQIRRPQGLSKSTADLSALTIGLGSEASISTDHDRTW